MVSFNSRISPRASTRIFCDRSPLATAVVTSAMLRTWSVRLSAMTFTDSVSAFQVPETPLTSAWPPSRPSVPTSRATRVTSSANDESWSTMVLMVWASAATSPLASTVIFCDRSPLATAVAAKEDSWSTMVLTVFLSSRISPRASTVIFWERSPLATAVVTSAMERTWLVRLPAIAFTESVRSFQVPDTAGTSAWPPSCPSVPTSRATRVTSEVNRESWSTIPLKTVAISVSRPSPSSGSRVPKSPSRTAVRPARSCRRSSSGSPPAARADRDRFAVPALSTMSTLAITVMNRKRKHINHCRTLRLP